MSDELDTTPPTARQQLAVDFVVNCKRRGYNCTVREIMAAIGVKSPAGAMYHLKALRKKGLITWEPSLARSIRATEAHHAAT